MIHLEEYETAVNVTGNERYTFCDVCGKKHKKNQGIKISYDFSDTFGAGNWNVCEDCEKNVVKKLRKLLEALNGEEGDTMNADTIEAIKKILAKGDRVELIPVKNGVKIIRVRREEIIPGSKR